MERSSAVHGGGMRGHSGPRDWKGRAALCQSGSGTAVSNKTEVCDFLSQNPLWVAFVRTVASSVPSCPAHAHGVKISCDPHLSENTTRVICDFFESNTTDIDQRNLPNSADKCECPSEKCVDALPSCLPCQQRECQTRFGN